MKALHLLALSSVLSASLLLAQTTPPATTDAPTATKSKKKAKADAGATAAPAASAAAAPASKPPVKIGAQRSPAPTTAEIADAKAKGLVWLNLNTNVYHASGDKEYGVTKNGKFLSEADAKATGARLAKK